MQIYVALIAFFLLRMFQQGPASSHKAGARAFSQQIESGGIPKSAMI
jgi:hypothetical protein